MLRLLGACLAILLAGCATSAKHFRPDSVPRGHGGVSGRIRVFKNGTEVTKHCYIQFKDGTASAKLYTVSLDASGWVFTTLPQGDAQLVDLACVVWNGLTWPMGLRFDIQGGGRVAYFGDLDFRLREDWKVHLADAMRTAAATTPGVSGSQGASLRSAANAVEQNTEATKYDFELHDKSDELKREYEKRYGRLPPGALFTSLADSEPFQPPVRVLRKEDLLWSEVELRGMKLTWLGSVRGEEPRLGIRLQRYVSTPALMACSEASLKVDGQEIRFATSYHQEQAMFNRVRETLQGEIALETLRKVGAAKQSLLDVCGLHRGLPAAAAEAAAKLAAAYEEETKAKDAREGQLELPAADSL